MLQPMVNIAVHFQVGDVDRKFINLNELRANNWVRKEEIKPELIPKKTGSSKKKMKAPPVRPVSAKSSLRAHIAAARKKMNSKYPNLLFSILFFKNSLMKMNEN